MESVIDHERSITRRLGPAEVRRHPPSSSVRPSTEAMTAAWEPPRRRPYLPSLSATASASAAAVCAAGTTPAANPASRSASAVVGPMAPSSAPASRAASGPEPRHHAPHRRRRGEGDGVHPPLRQQRAERRQRARQRGDGPVGDRRRHLGARRRAARRPARAARRRRAAPAPPGPGRAGPARRPAPRRWRRTASGPGARTSASSLAPVAGPTQASRRSASAPRGRPSASSRATACSTALALAKATQANRSSPQQRGVEGREVLGVGQRDGRELQHLGPQLAQPGAERVVAARAAGDHHGPAGQRAPGHRPTS